MPPHRLTNLVIQKYYQNDPKRSSKNESKFTGAYSRDNLSDKMKDGAHIINLGEYPDIGTHWVALYVSNNDATYFDSFGVEFIP